MTMPDPNGSPAVDPESELVHRSTAPPEPGTGASVGEIEADIERTRHDLGETVETLAGKLDVKGRAKHQLDATRRRLAAQANDVGRRARAYVDQARRALTDERGRPNRNGWIGLSAAAIASVAAVAAILVGVRRSRR